MRHIQLKPVWGQSWTKVVKQQKSPQAFRQESRSCTNCYIPSANNSLGSAWTTVPHHPAYHDVTWTYGIGWFRLMVQSFDKCIPYQFFIWCTTVRWILQKLVQRFKNCLAVSLSYMQDVWAPSIAWHLVASELCQLHMDGQCSKMMPSSTLPYHLFMVSVLICSFWTIWH
jgi:hypothetical protein